MRKAMIAGATAMALVLSSQHARADITDGQMEDVLEELHEFAGNGTLMLVIAHLGLLVMGFRRQGTTQVMSMVSGRMPGKGPDLVHHNRVWLGALILMCVLAFWAWQWQTRPAPTDHPITHATHAQHGHHTDDDD